MLQRDPLGQREDGRRMGQAPPHEDPGITRWKRYAPVPRPRSWACFEQRLLRDRPGAEIAAELGIEPSTVFVNACRVLKQVRAVCQEFDEDLSDALDSSLSRRD